MSVVDDDPYGDKAHLEQRRLARERGRRAILDQAEDWRPPAADEDDAPAEDGEPEEETLRLDHVVIPRIFGKIIRQVPISLPEDCPITPLGKFKRVYSYLSPLGELVELTDAEHGQAHIEALWSPDINALHRAFPQFNQQGKFKGFAAQYARAAMLAACGRKGIFYAHEKVRGRGCWRGENGELVQHLGDRVLVGTQEHKPGEIDGYVYPGGRAMPAGRAGGRAEVEALYGRYQQWNWVRGELDARLLLGQQVSTILGAALEWRPMAFICGDASTGKSSLQRDLRAMLPGRLVGTTDASEAGLRVLVGQDSIGVSFDEIEADATNDKAQAVMKLARTSASGDDAYRSNASQGLNQFTVRGSFTFSAIIPPSMRAADAQRFTFLRLQTLPADAVLVSLEEAELRDRGAALVGRIAGGWSRWKRTLDAFALGLARAGHAQRGALQFGTLLAGAHIVLEDRDPTTADIDLWCGQLRRETLFEYENSEPTWMQAWRHIMTSQPEMWRQDGFPTVGEMIRKYLVADLAENGKEERLKVHDKLTRAGLAIVKQRHTNKVFLAIPPKHQGVAAMFAGHDMGKKGGGEGAWSIPLRGAPKLIGDVGVLHVENVPRLGRQKCALFWLDGKAEIGGVLTPIFDRVAGEDLIDAPVEREPGEEG